MVDSTFQGMSTSCLISPALKTSAVAQEWLCISAVAQAIDVIGLTMRIQ